jgi:predicted O-methyltransferase YrrM
MQSIKELDPTVAAALIEMAEASKYEDYRSMRFLFYLSTLFNEGIVLEHGTYHGCSTAHFALAGHTVVTIDTQEEVPWQELYDNFGLLKLLGRVSFVKGLAKNTKTLFREAAPWGALASIFFIDATHDYNNNLLEYREARENLAPRHILVIDDTDCVMRLCEDLAVSYPVYRLLPYHHGMAVLATSEELGPLIDRAIELAEAPEE